MTTYIIPRQKRSTYYYIIREIADRKTERVMVIPIPWETDIDSVHRNLYKHAPWGWTFALDRGRNQIHVIKWREDEDPSQEV